MNPDVKAKWLTRLRSEEFEQGHGQLGVDQPGEKPRRCCLGVLCEVAVDEGIIEKKVVTGDVIFGVNLAMVASTPDDVRGSEDLGAWDSAKFYLPKAVREWADLPHYSPTVPLPDNVGPELATDHTGEEVNLASLNDSATGYGFDEIADAIESGL